MKNKFDAEAFTQEIADICEQATHDSRSYEDDAKIINAITVMLVTVIGVVCSGNGKIMEAILKNIAAILQKDGLNFKDADTLRSWLDQNEKGERLQ